MHTYIDPSTFVIVRAVLCIIIIISYSGQQCRNCYLLSLCSMMALPRLILLNHSMFHLNSFRVGESCIDQRSQALKLVGLYINHCLSSTCSELCITSVCLNQSRKFMMISWKVWCEKSQNYINSPTKACTFPSLSSGNW